MLVMCGEVEVIREVWRGSWVAGGEACLKKMCEEVDIVGESS